MWSRSGLSSHGVGEQGREMWQIGAGGMAAELWVGKLAEVEWADPTFTAIVGLAARRMVRELGVLPLAPEWRALARAPAAEWERRD